MNDSTSASVGLPDPLALWRELLTKGETTSNAALNRFMSTDAFASLFGRSNSLLLGVQGLFNELIPKYLAAVHMPSREEVSELGERLTAIEDRLIRLSDAIARISPGRSAAADRPPKTRQPSSRPEEAPPATAAAALPPAAAAAPAKRRRAGARKHAAPRGST
jgi:hypothetical protein